MYRSIKTSLTLCHLALAQKKKQPTRCFCHHCKDRWCDVTSDQPMSSVCRKHSAHVCSKQTVICSFDSSINMEYHMHENPGLAVTVTAVPYTKEYFSFAFFQTDRSVVCVLRVSVCSEDWHGSKAEIKITQTAANVIHIRFVAVLNICCCCFISSGKMIHTFRLKWHSDKVLSGIVWNSVFSLVSVQARTGTTM